MFRSAVLRADDGDAVVADYMRRRELAKAVRDAMAKARVVGRLISNVSVSWLASGLSSFSCVPFWVPWAGEERGRFHELLGEAEQSFRWRAHRVLKPCGAHHFSCADFRRLCLPEAQGNAGPASGSPVGRRARSRQPRHGAGRAGHRW